VPTKPTKKMTIYIDERILLVIDMAAKLNRQSGNPYNTINKMLVGILKNFVTNVMESPVLAKDVIQKIYAHDVLKNSAANKKVLRKILGRKPRPYPFDVSIELYDRFVDVCEIIEKELQFKIPKANIHSIVFLNFVIDSRESLRNAIVDFLDQDYFLPYTDKTELADLQTPSFAPDVEFQEKVGVSDEVKFKEIQKAFLGLDKMLGPGEKEN